jgi:hypothetical protein
LAIIVESKVYHNIIGAFVGSFDRNNSDARSLIAKTLPQNCQ